MKQYLRSTATVEAALKASHANENEMLAKRSFKTHIQIGSQACKQGIEK